MNWFEFDLNLFVGFSGVSFLYYSFVIIAKKIENSAKKQLKNYGNILEPIIAKTSCDSATYLKRSGSKTSFPGTVIIN